MSNEVQKKVDEISDHLNQSLKTSFLGHYKVTDKTIAMVTQYIIEGYDINPEEYDIDVSIDEVHKDKVNVVVTKLRPSDFISINVIVSREGLDPQNY